MSTETSATEHHHHIAFTIQTEGIIKAEATCTAPDGIDEILNGRLTLDHPRLPTGGPGRTPVVRGLVRGWPDGSRSGDVIRRAPACP